MTSRLTSEVFAPSVPAEMPSLIVIVPNLKGTPLAARTPSFAASANRSRWTLQGVTSLARLAMATNGFSMSSWVMPIAINMALAGARSGSWVSSLLRCLVLAAFVTEDKEHLLTI